MAEAHAAVAFSFVVTDEGVSLRFDKNVINAVLSSGVRSWKRLGAHLKALLKLASSHRVRLYSYQDALSCLPVPPLMETIRRYLKSIKPLHTSEEYKSIENKALEFAQSYTGKKLQFYVKLKWLISSNYVSDWWEDYIYLSNRSPLICNSNYFGLGPLVTRQGDAPFFEMPGMAPRAALLSLLLLEKRREITHETCKPIMVRGLIPLCSSQYERQFNTTRIPLPNKDKVVHFKSSNHIVVLHRGRYFKCNIMKNGKLISPRDLEYTIDCIINETSEPKPGEAKLSAFTAGPRDIWTNARLQYFSKGLNKISLDVIERSAFIITFDDDEYPWKINDLTDPVEAKHLNHFAKSALHGKITDRWFDKSFNLIIDKNGQCASNNEHSWADAPIMAQLVEQCIIWEGMYNKQKRPNFYDLKLLITRLELRYDVATMSYVDNHCHGEIQHFIKPVRLDWDIPEECITLQEQSYKISKELADDTDIYLLVFSDYGKGAIKKAGLSPDSFVQTALQLAIYLDANRFFLTYEASMTRLFRDGRTETVRSCTEESCTFVKSMFDSSKSISERFTLLKLNCENHQNLYRDAMTGKGVDRHLFALYLVAKFLQIETPFLKEVLSEPWRLSTSQTPQGQVDDPLKIFPKYLNVGGGFGPVADDGYGVAYMFIEENFISFNISSKFSCPNTSSERLHVNVRKAMLMLKDLIDAHSQYEKQKKFDTKKEI